MSEPTPRDQRMYALMNSGAGRALYATATRRRAVVGAHIALTAAATATWIIGVFGVQLWGVIAMLVLTLPWCIATGMINSATRGLLQLRGRVLDERQRAERNQVFAIAHHANLWLLFAGFLGVCVLWFADIRLESLIAPVLLIALVLHWLMPMWVAGLRVLDEPEADGELSPAEA